MRKNVPKADLKIIENKIDVAVSNDDLPKGITMMSLLTTDQMAKFNYSPRSLVNNRTYYQQSGGEVRLGPKWIRTASKTIRYAVLDILRNAQGLEWSEPYPRLFNPASKISKKIRDIQNKYKKTNKHQNISWHSLPTNTNKYLKTFFIQS